jgi:class 3 adenylate cyclase
VTKPASPIRRRLAAIFCADVAAYARLMSIDETGTLYLLNAHNEVLDRQITQHNGRTANTAGDSIVAEFPSAVDAVRCALDVQGALPPSTRTFPRSGGSCSGSECTLARS